MKSLVAAALAAVALATLGACGGSKCVDGCVNATTLCAPDALETSLAEKTCEEHCKETADGCTEAYYQCQLDAKTCGAAVSCACQQ